MMPRGSEDADPGAQNRYQFFMYIGALLLF